MYIPELVRNCLWRSLNRTYSWDDGQLTFISFPLLNTSVKDKFPSTTLLMCLRNFLFLWIKIYWPHKTTFCLQAYQCGPKKSEIKSAKSSKFSNAIFTIWSHAVVTPVLQQLSSVQMPSCIVKLDNVHSSPIMGRVQYGQRFSRFMILLITDNNK